MASARAGLWPWQERRHEAPEGAGALGLRIFFASLGVLFGAAVLGIAVVRWKLPDAGVRVAFPPVGWASTGALAMVSLAMHAGVRALREDRKRIFQGAMVAALLAAYAFVAFQCELWSQLLAQESALASAVESGMYAFLLLTVLHIAHVAGGVVFQGLVTWRALRDVYWSLHTGPVRGSALYWHFIDAVWVVLLAFLLAIR